MRVAVFDLDGTLADTSADLIAAANAALSEAGHGAPLGAAEDRGIAFAGGRALLRAGLERAHGDAGEADRLYPRLLEMYAAALAVHTRLYDGARAALERLAAAGSDVWRTDRDGTITVATDGRTMQLSGRDRYRKLRVDPEESMP